MINRASAKRYLQWRSVEPCKWEACGPADRNKTMEVDRAHAAQELDGDTEEVAQE